MHSEDTYGRYLHHNFGIMQRGIELEQRGWRNCEGVPIRLSGNDRGDAWCRAMGLELRVFVISRD